MWFDPSPPAGTGEKEGRTWKLYIFCRKLEQLVRERDRLKKREKKEEEDEKSDAAEFAALFKEGK